MQIHKIIINISKRDIKPENIFMDDAFKRVVLADLGLIKHVDRGLAKTTCGSLVYQAPGI